jgi:hypothetical protein
MLSAATMTPYDPSNVRILSLTVSSALAAPAGSGGGTGVAFIMQTGWQRNAVFSAERMISCDHRGSASVFYWSAAAGKFSDKVASCGTYPCFNIRSSAMQV